MFWYLDLSTVGVLAGIALLEGFRRAPEDALIVQRSLFSDWRVWTGRRDGRFHLLSWWAPLFTTIVLQPSDGPAREAPAGMQTVLRALASWILYLRLLGCLILVLLVIGVPAATGRFGADGFFLALAALAILSLNCAGAVYGAVRVSSMSQRPALRFAAGFLSPFSAPRAAEALLQEILRRFPTGAVAQHLLPRELFSRWVRPYAYDVAHGENKTAAAVVSGIDPNLIRAALGIGGSLETGARFQCARCGVGFTGGTDCPDCGIPLDPLVETSGPHSPYSPQSAVNSRAQGAVDPPRLFRSAI